MTRALGRVRFLISSALGASDRRPVSELGHELLTPLTAVPEAERVRFSLGLASCEQLRRRLELVLAERG